MSEKAFLRAILDDPADDTARLVYADWLDDHGEAERAEFIRAQIGLAQHRLYRNDPQCRCGTCTEMLEAENRILGARDAEWRRDAALGFGFVNVARGLVWHRGFLVDTLPVLPLRPPKPPSAEELERRRQRDLERQALWLLRRSPEARRVMRGFSQMTPQQRAAVIARLSE